MKYDEVQRRSAMKAYGKRLGKIVILAAVLNFLIEFISRKSFAVLLAYVLESPLVFLLNTCIIALPFTVLFLTRRRVFVAIVLSIVWLGMGVVNGILLIFRTTPFTAADFRLIKYAANIATTYFTWMQLVMIAVALVVVTVFCVFVWRIAPVGREKVNYVKGTAVVGISAAVVLGLTTAGGGAFRQYRSGVSGIRVPLLFCQFHVQHGNLQAGRLWYGDDRGD